MKEKPEFEGAREQRRRTQRAHRGKWKAGTLPSVSARPAIVRCFVFLRPFFKRWPCQAASYVSQYPPAPSQYRVTFASDVSGGASNKAAPSSTGGPKGRDVGVSSKSAMSLRMILDASMLTLRNRCEETARSLADLSKALAAGSGEELHRQFLECFPELVGAIFGLPAQTSSAGGSAVTTPSPADRSVGWMQSAMTVEDYESVYQLLQGKGSLFSLLVQLSCLQQAPVYVFPAAALPADAFQVLQASGLTAVGATGGGMAGGNPLHAFLSARLNRNQQRGLSLNMLEYYLFGFAWAATQAGGGSSAGFVSGSASRISSILSGNKGSSSSSGSGSSGKTLPPDPFKTRFNALYTSLLRQYALSLLELEARADAMSGSSLMRGMHRGGTADAAKGEAYFQVFVAIASLFWLHQNPSQFFFAASAAVNAASLSSSGSAAANKGSLFLFRSRYVAPTYLVVNAMYDLLTLLLHSAAADSSAPSSATTGSAFGGGAPQYQFHQLQQPSAHQLGASPVAVAAGRIANLAMREIVSDSLYRFLKLGLVFAPSLWPFLATLWRLAASPWTQAPLADSYAFLVRTHERYQLSLQEQDRRLSYGAPPPPVAGAGAAAVQEEFPYSTQVLSPFDPTSLVSPFVLPKKKAASSSLAAASSSFAGGFFNLSSIFGGSGLSTGPVESPSIGLPTQSLLAPQNWAWYTFDNPAAPLGALWPATPLPDVHPLAQEIRAFVVANYPLYSLLFRTWLVALHEHFVEQTQPLSYALLLALEKMLELLTASSVLLVLRELESAIHQPLDRFSDGRLEIEKRVVLERWMVLEHAAHPPLNLLSDAHVAELAVDLLKEVSVFSRLSNEAKSSVFKGLIFSLSRELEVMFGFARADLEARVAAAASASVPSASQSQSSQRVGGGAAVGTTMRLTQEQQAMLRDGRLRMDQSGIGFIGDVWDKPVSSSESFVVLWILFRLSLLLGLAERKPNATKTYLNLRPLGSKAVLWALVVVIVAVVIVTRLARLDLSGLFELGDEE